MTPGSVLQVRKILVPTDFSACAAAALDCAVELAKKWSAEILLLHVVPDFAQYVAPDLAVALPVVIESARSQGTAELEKARKSITGVTVRTELLEGPIHERILSAAAAGKVDMIVLGTHGRTGVKHALLGSVAERIVRVSPVPVLTVRLKS